MNWFTDEDQKNLEAFDNQNRAIRDWARVVAQRGVSGVYIYGPKGTSKTYTVTSILDEEGFEYTLIASRITAASIFGMFKDNPHHTFVFDDVSSIFKDRIAVSILLSALGKRKNGQRKVEYHTHKNSEVIDFTGGIIALSNVMLATDPISQALASRVQPLEYNPTQSQIKAYMKKLAMTSGFQGLPIEASKEIVSFIIEASVALSKPLDLRNADNAAGVYRICQTSPGESSWQDMVMSSIKSTACINGEKLVMNQVEKTAHYQSMVFQIHQEGKSKGWTMEQMAIRFSEQSGMAGRTFYRHLKELREGGKLPYPPKDILKFEQFAQDQPEDDSDDDRCQDDDDSEWGG